MAHLNGCGGSLTSFSNGSSESSIVDLPMIGGRTGREIRVRANIYIHLLPPVGPRAGLLQRERYIWSVFPSLAAWPALMMEPAPGSLCIAFLIVRRKG